jgi:RAB protein geranylgeranyltransferase component A
MAREVDYLIVGQGLAGSLLACLLQMQRQEVLVIDTPIAPPPRFQPRES